MGARGPLPQKANLKLVNGSKTPPAAEAPQPEGPIADPPEWLGETAKAKYRELAPQLQALGLLAAIDIDTLTGYCVALEEVQIATQALAEEGRFIQGPRGNLAQHPAIAAQRSALRAMNTFAATLGLSPASRQRINVPQPEEPDEMDRFLAGS